eukprot:361719-Chlamydomonas_euryale.AAC.2
METPPPCLWLISHRPQAAPKYPPTTALSPPLAISTRIPPDHLPTNLITANPDSLLQTQLHYFKPNHITSKPTGPIAALRLKRFAPHRLPTASQPPPNRLPTASHLPTASQPPPYRLPTASHHIASQPPPNRSAPHRLVSRCPCHLRSLCSAVCKLPRHNRSRSLVACRRRVAARGVRNCACVGGVDGGGAAGCAESFHVAR